MYAILSFEIDRPYTCVQPY